MHKDTAFENLLVKRIVRILRVQDIFIVVAYFNNCLLRKPAGRLGVVSPCERSENKEGVWGCFSFGGTVQYIEESNIYLCFVVCRLKRGLVT